MSDQRPEIQRFNSSQGVDVDGTFVYHYDHLHHLTLAQIAVLEEAAKLCESYNPCHEVFADHFKDKIDRLRKELGE